jgi:anti-sigma-K factor RskA
MTLHPVLPVPLLVAIAAALVAGQAVALRRWRRGDRNRAQLWRWAGMTLAAVLMLAAACRIVVGDEQAAIRSADDLEPNVFVLVDRSPDMAVEDMDDRSRMVSARNDIQALIDRYPHARFAVIGFASAPSVQWPLSADTWSLRPVLDVLAPYPYGPDAPAQASAGAAATVLRYHLISASAQYPRAANLVFYLGVGSPESRLPARQFEPPAGSVGGGAVLGYGTPAGGPIPGTDVERSPVDGDALRAVAGQLGVPYVARAAGTPLAAALSDDTARRATTASAAVSGQTETYWLLALVAAALVLVELYLVLRDFRRHRYARVKEMP